MLSDFINVDKNSKTPMYIQIFFEIKNAVENGNLKENEKLPSVRKLCADLGVSKTTVENAYNMLCSQGYIMNKPQSGFFVEKGLQIKKSNKKTAEARKQRTPCKYDFSGKGIDNQCSNIKEWRKYVKDILNKEYLLNTYSENQGETELREAITKYAFYTRGVNLTEDNIVIGSGSQTLIYILCGILGQGKTAAIEKNSFPQAEQSFKDYGYEIKYAKTDKKGITVEWLNQAKPDIVLLNPNYSSENGSAMPIARKIEILAWAKENGCVIIEDDYNGELRYKTHPTACIQSYDSEQTVYIGSFSKILLPSVRISYMVLPEYLKELYAKKRERYNQTTSKIEQLALAKYIKDGRLEKHLRKSRRYYNTKSAYMLKILRKYFNDIKFNETGMYFEIPAESDGIIKRLGENGVRVTDTSTDYTIRLSFAQINPELIEDGVKAVAKAVKTDKQ